MYMYAAGDCANMEFVTREEWEAREPRTTINVSTPFSMTFVHHTDGPSCFTLEECSETVRGIQDFHMDGNGKRASSRAGLSGLPNGRQRVSELRIMQGIHDLHADSEPVTSKP